MPTFNDLAPELLLLICQEVSPAATQGGREGLTIVA